MKMCVHARVSAENGADHIVISSPDTDVLMLLLHHRPAISASKVFFFTCTEEKHADLTRYIPVKVHDSLETSLTQHFTACLLLYLPRSFLQLTTVSIYTYAVMDVHLSAADMVRSCCANDGGP